MLMQVDSGTITVNVTPVNDPPWALGLDGIWVNFDERSDRYSYGGTEDTPLQLFLTGIDHDGDPITFEIVSQPTHGTLVEATPYPSAQHDHCEGSPRWL